MDGAYHYVPGWRRRLFSRLGFGPATAPDPEEREGFTEAYHATETIAELDWKDRLRLLISGRCMVVTKLKTEKPIGRSFATGAFNILPPKEATDGEESSIEGEAGG